MGKPTGEPSANKGCNLISSDLHSFTAWMERGKSQDSLPGNQDVHNDAGSLRFTRSLFDYCLVWGANSFEEMELQRTFNANEMVIRTPSMIVGCCVAEHGLCLISSTLGSQCYHFPVLGDWTLACSQGMNASQITFSSFCQAFNCCEHWKSAFCVDG